MSTQTPVEGGQSAQTVTQNFFSGEPAWTKFKKINPSGNPMDFQVRVHIIECRDLQPRDKNGMSDPVCFVSVHGDKKNTKTYKKTTSCTWDHLMFWELKYAPEEFFSGKIQVAVFDANTVFRNVEIGTFNFDLSYVYEQPNHEIYRKWVALTDSAGKFPGIQGYLKLSITVIGPKDVAPAHDENEEIDDEEATGSDLQSMLLLPPNIQVQEYSLDINIFRAEGLPKMDQFGKCDGYVVAKFGSHQLKTEIIKNTYSPVWGERLSIPFTMPTMSDIIKLQVLDWDAGQSDDIVGTVFLRLSEVMGGKVDWRSPRWVNIYAIPDGVATSGLTKEVEIANKMLNGVMEGTCFRGRVLLSMNAQPTKDPKAGKSKISPSTEPSTGNFTLRFDLLEAAELPTNSDVSVEVSLGLFKKDSAKAKVNNKTATWYTAFDDVAMALPKDRNQIPDVFINIYKHSLTSKKRIGYIRIPATELTNSFDPKWFSITPDIFGDADKNQVAGFLQVNINLSEQYPGMREKIQKPNLVKYELRAHIYQGRELISADSEGASDPYCLIRMGKSFAKTKIVKETVFPIWYESFVIPVELPEGLKFAPDIHVQCYDWDQMSADDFLGRFSVRAKDVSDIFQPPRWYDLYTIDPNLPEGSILASFQLIPADRAASIPQANITPKYKDCTVEVSVIGLRDLLPFNLLPINKPYLVIDSGTGAKVSTKGCDKPSGSAPNFLETLTFSLPIPEDKIFAPPINIKVYDDRLIHKPLIATRSISLAAFLPWTKASPEDLITSEDIQPIVDKIPGARPGSDAEVVEESTPVIPTPSFSVRDHLTVDIPGDGEDDDKSSLLRTQHRDLLDVTDQLSHTLKERTLPDVAESVLPGTELDDAVDEKPKRDTIKAELETQFSKPPFTLLHLYRSKRRQGKNIKVEVGEFKGRFRVYETKDKNKVEPPLDLIKMYQPTPYIVRLYMLEGFQLVPKDADGNNPYIRISTNGKFNLKDVDNKKQATSRPQFFKCYEVPCTFPTETLVNVQVWDWDRIGSDDLIGTTRIDLENRFHCDEWKSLKFKPIEFRTLWNPSSSNPQGQVKMWVDILTPDEAKNNPPEVISPPTPAEYELRVIVWNTRNVILKDRGIINKEHQSSDILVVGFPDGQEPQSTDTHWNSKNGEGMFNWRLKFPLILPPKVPRFKLQVWDRNVMTPNGAICEANLNFRGFYNGAYKKKLNRKEIARQWVSMTHPNAQGVQGEVEVTIEILSADEAKRRPAGFGREQPNENPTLDPPNRPPDSLAPWDLASKAKLGIGRFWAANKWKFYGGFICIFVTIILIIVLKFIL